MARWDAGRENSNCGVSATKYLTLLVNKVRARVTDSSQTAPLIPLTGPRPGKTLISG